MLQSETVRKYDTYKDSGIEWIGEIPQEWEIRKIKYLAKIGSGDSLTKELLCENGNFPVFGGGSIIGYTNDYNTTFDNILIGRVGANCGCITWLNNNCWATDNALKVKLMTNLHKKLFYYFLISLELNRLNDSNAQPLITSTKILNTFVSYPADIIEQQRIAEYLDKKCGEIDRVIETEKAVIEKLKEYKQSIITEAVTKGLDKSAPLKDSGIEWIGKIPQHWSVVRLKYKFRIKKDIAGKEGFDILSVTQRGLKIKDITTNEGQLAMDYSKYQLVEPTDFVMNHMDLLTGWVDCSKYSGVTSPDYRVFVNIDMQKCDNEYYKHIFQTCYRNKIFFGLGQGVSDLGRWRLQADKFLNFVIPVPPITEQQKINNFIDKKCSEIDKVIANKEQVIEKLTEYKKSLIYECVTGKRKVAD